MLGSAFDENTLQWKKTVEIGTESAILVQVLSLCLFVCLFLIMVNGSDKDVECNVCAQLYT